MNNSITIKKVKFKDIEKIRIWRNKQIDVLRQKKKILKNEQITYFKKNIFIKNKKNILFFLKDGKKDIAYGGLTNINFKIKKSEISFLFKPKYEKKKNFFYYKYFLAFIKKLAFEKLKLNVLFTETYSFRKNFINFYKNNNFKLIKIKKNTVTLKKKNYNSVFFEVYKS